MPGPHLTNLSVVIVPLTYPPDVGGVARAAQRWAFALRRRGAAVSVVAVTDCLAPGRLDVADEDGVTVVRTGKHQRAADTLSE